MKAYELQIGDWVCYDDDIEYSNPLKVDGLTTDDISIDEEGFLGGIDGTVRPIHLTEDILEENGWISTDFGYYRDDVNFFVVVSNGRGTGVSTNLMNEVIFWFDYVHQLQHALRLCGLDNLADNFKIG